MALTKEQREKVQILKTESEKLDTIQIMAKEVVSKFVPSSKSAEFYEGFHDALEAAAKIGLQLKDDSKALLAALPFLAMAAAEKLEELDEGEDKEDEIWLEELDLMI